MTGIEDSTREDVIADRPVDGGGKSNVWLVLCLCLVGAFYFVWLSRVLYQVQSPFFDSLSYFEKLHRVMSLTRSEGLLAGWFFRDAERIEYRLPAVPDCNSVGVFHRTMSRNRHRDSSCRAVLPVVVCRHLHAAYCKNESRVPFGCRSGFPRSGVPVLSEWRHL